MKKKIKNILKYILTYSTLAIMGGLLFFSCLTANVKAYRQDNLKDYYINNSATENNDIFFNNNEEYVNENYNSSSFSANTFNTRTYNIKNYILNQNSNVSSLSLAIPFYTHIELPQSNNYNDNEYNMTLYYIFSNSTTFTNNDFQNYVYSTYYNIGKSESSQTTNYIADTIYLDLYNAINDNYTYLIIGYYSNVDFNTSGYTPKWSYYENYINDNYMYLINNSITQAQSEKIQELNNQNQTLQNRINEQNNEINTLNEDYTTMAQELESTNLNYLALQRNYNSLQNQYNQLATQDYTFENLFWSIGSVPMAFLMQSFNVNVLGMNIARVITGLITALLVLWIIKKILK